MHILRNTYVIYSFTNIFIHSFIHPSIHPDMLFSFPPRVKAASALNTHTHKPHNSKIPIFLLDTLPLSLYLAQRKNVKKEK